MVAIDFLVGGLLLCSISVNILALGAFWVTPSLRTTANRFVINLLIVNLVCCIILGPSLLLNAVITKPSITFYDANKTSDVVIVNKTKIVNDTILLSNDNVDDSMKSEMKDDAIDEKLTLTEIRCWGLDLAAALGALSVLLVVGDTWCAITDPLRYHTRISDLKAWCYIATTWLLGIIFGIASAFRGDQQNVSLFTNRVGVPADSSHIQKNITSAQNFNNNGLINHLNISDDLYNTIFSYTYFIVVILLPFGLVCGMYWRIFSEARESGQRMRQNGSSPLLQSALNLAAVSAAKQEQKHIEHKEQHKEQSTDGLTMKIDKQIHYNTNISNNFNNSSLKHKESCLKPLLQTTPTHKIEDKSLIVQKVKVTQKQDKNHNNILLTLTSSNSSDKIRRNYSARQLVFEERNVLKTGLRHVHSTPNFQKMTPIDIGCDSRGNHQILPMPTVQVPPKALSYMTSIRHRLSNASSLFKYREESRAARISILVIIMFLVSYLPYGILVLMQGHTDFLLASDQALLAIFTVVVANLSSPFIFAYRNKRVRRGVKRLLGIDKKTNERLQKITNSNTNYNNNNNNNNNNINNSFNNNSSPSTNHKSKVRIANMQRSNSSCKYLTPNHAAAVAVANGFIVEMERFPSDDINSLCIQKKSILKRVCDSSRKWGCNFTTNSCTSNDEQTEV